MRFLTKKQQDELLLRITANEIIAVTSKDVALSWLKEEVKEE